MTPSGGGLRLAYYPSVKVEAGSQPQPTKSRFPQTAVSLCGPPTPHSVGDERKTFLSSHVEEALEALLLASNCQTSGLVSSWKL